MALLVSAVRRRRGIYDWNRSDANANIRRRRGQHAILAWMWQVEIGCGADRVFEDTPACWLAGKEAIMGDLNGPKCGRSLQPLAENRREVFGNGRERGE